MGDDRKLSTRRTWLELEMGFEWSEKLGAFINLDLEREFGRGNRAPRISRDLFTRRLSFRVFQRAVQIVIDRARKELGQSVAGNRPPSKDFGLGSVRETKHRKSAP